MSTVARFVNDLDRLVQQAVLKEGLKLAKGQCQNMEEYKRHVGRCEGMAEAVNMGREMLRQMELADDDDGGLPEMDPGARAGGAK